MIRPKRYKMIDTSPETEREQRELFAATLYPPGWEKDEEADAATEKLPEIPEPPKTGLEKQLQNAARTSSLTFFQPLEELTGQEVKPMAVPQVRLPWEKDSDLHEEEFGEIDEEIEEEIEEVEPDPEVVVDISVLPEPIGIAEPTEDVGLGIFENISKTEVPSLEVVEEEEIENVPEFLTKEDLEFTKVKKDPSLPKRKYTKKNKENPELNPILEPFDTAPLHKIMEMLSPDTSEPVVVENISDDMISDPKVKVFDLPPSAEPPRACVVENSSKAASVEIIQGEIANSSEFIPSSVTSIPENIFQSSAITRLAAATERIAFVLETWWDWVKLRETWESAWESLTAEEKIYHALRPETAPISEAGNTRINHSLKNALLSTPSVRMPGYLQAPPYFLARYRALAARIPNLKIPEKNAEGFATVNGVVMKIKDLETDRGFQEHVLRTTAEQPKKLRIKQFAQWLADQYQAQRCWIHQDQLEAFFRACGIVTANNLVLPVQASFVLSKLFERLPINGS